MRNIPSPMTMAEVSSGLVHLEESKNQSLLSQHNSLQPSKINLLILNHPPNLAHQKPNVVNSPSCSVTWSIPRNCLLNSTRKTGGMWYGRISTCVPMSSSATMDISRNTLAMGSWCILATHKVTKTKHSELSPRVWVFSMP